MKRERYWIFCLLRVGGWSINFFSFFRDKGIELTVPRRLLTKSSRPCRPVSAGNETLGPSNVPSLALRNWHTIEGAVPFGSTVDVVNVGFLRCRFGFGGINVVILVPKRVSSGKAWWLVSIFFFSLKLFSFLLFVFAYFFKKEIAIFEEKDYYKERFAMTTRKN